MGVYRGLRLRLFVVPRVCACVCVQSVRRRCGQPTAAEDLWGVNWVEV